MAVPCTETMQTLEALRSTPKGSLSYEQRLLWEKTDRKGKLELLHQWNSPPPISPEAIDYITDRAKQLSLDSSPQHKQQENPLVANDITVTSLPGAMPQSQYTTGLNVSTPGFDESSESVIGEIRRELNTQEQSIDDQMMAEVSNDVREKRKWFTKNLEHIRRAAEERRKLERERREREARLSQEREEALQVERQIKIREEIESLTEHYKFHEEMMESKLKSGEEEKREIMRKTMERKQMELQRQMRRCVEQKELAQRTITQLDTILQSCGYAHLLSQAVYSEFQVVGAGLKDVQVELFNMEQSGVADAKQIDRLQAKLSGYLPKVVDLKATIEEINQRGEKEARQNEELLRQTAEKLKEQERQAKEKEIEKEKEKEEETKREREKKAATTVEGGSAKDSDGGSGDKGKATAVSEPTDLGMPTSMLAVYEDLQEKLSKAAAATEGMTSTSDPSIKRYRFRLQNAVTSTINSISANSGEDLRGKISRLRRLIRGEQIDVMGRPLSIRDHPAAKMYCCNLLAKKLVMQGEDQVASNHEAAFPISAVAVGIWSEFPDVGDLILAHFYSMCPVLVPLYVPRSKGMSEADHMKLQGYKVSSKGVVESEDMFLNRMRGVVRLYAAVVQTPSLPVGPALPHPHNLEYGWAWLARVLNMEPHPTLTATAVGDFLETAGHALLKKYNKQFKKLLFVLCKEYVPMIEKVTPADQRGPLSRLKQFLEECISSGHIPQPKGCLDNRFWQTRSQGIAVA